MQNKNNKNKIIKIKINHQNFILFIIDLATFATGLLTFSTTLTTDPVAFLIPSVDGINFLIGPNTLSKMPLNKSPINPINLDGRSLTN